MSDIFETSVPFFKISLSSDYLPFRPPFFFLFIFFHFFFLIENFFQSFLCPVAKKKKSICLNINNFFKNCFYLFLPHIYFSNFFPVCIHFLSFILFFLPFFLFLLPSVFVHFHSF